MGLNAYLDSVGSKGLKAGGTALETVRTIDGSSGKRLAIMAFSFTGNVSCPTCYIQSSVENGTGTAVVGASQLTVSPAIAGAIASGDNIAYYAANGTWNYAIASAGATSSLIGLTTAVATAITSGPIFWLGPYNGSGAAAVTLTAGFVATTGYSDIGRYFGNTKGSPMRISIPTGATSQSTSVDYVTYGYIKV